MKAILKIKREGERQKAMDKTVGKNKKSPNYWIISFIVMILLSVILLVSCYPSPVRVSADNEILGIGNGFILTVDVNEWLQSPSYSLPITEEKGANLYELDISGNKVEIGDEMKGFFEPLVKYNRWGGESWFSLRYNPQDIMEADSVLKDSEIEWGGEKENVYIYALTAEEVGAEYGGVEYEVVLKERPVSNVLTYDLSFSEDVVFHYQPALTPEEIKEGYYRPENVVGSYAVYSSNKKNHELGQINYQTGKIGHIYRSKVFDALSNEVWADLVIDTEAGVLRIEVPQEFLDKATYPVIVDPSFGYETIGAGTKWVNDDAFGGIFTLSEEGVAVSVSAYMYASGSGRVGSGAVYEGASGTGNKDRFDYATEDISISQTPGWHTSNQTGQTLSADDYLLLFGMYDSGYIYYDTVAGGEYMYGCPYSDYSDWTDPINITEANNWKRTSVYCTYSSAAEPSLSNTPSSENLGNVNENSTYYAYGSAPSNPVQDGECTFEIENVGSVSVNINISATNFTGGNCWELTEGTPGSDKVRLIAYYQGLNPADGVKLIPSPKSFYSIGLAPDAKLKWDFSLETGTFTDSEQKSSTITLTAVAP